MNGQTRSSDLMVVDTGVPSLSPAEELTAYYIYLLRRARDPGDLRSGKRWPSGGSTPFLSQQGLGGYLIWPSI